jgi:Domain of unknown function (DUF3601)
MTYGPKPLGTWSNHEAPNCGSSHNFLRAGQRYRVKREFSDHDGHAHPRGEEWLFLGYSFAPYDDGMSFFVSLDGAQEWQIRLQWRAEEQGHVLDHLSEYVGAL